MNFSKSYLDLIKDTFKFRAFKGMNQILLGFLIFALIPIIVIYAFSLVSYGIILFMFKIIGFPFDYIYQFVKTEGNDVKHATQAIIYWFAFPILLILKILMSFIVFLMCLSHLEAECLGFIATFGGIEFKPFLLDEHKGDADESVISHSFSASIVYTSIASLLCAFVLFWLTMERFSGATEIFYTNGTIKLVANLIYIALSALFIPISRAFATRHDPTAEDSDEDGVDTTRPRSRWQIVFICTLLAVILVSLLCAILSFIWPTSVSWSNLNLYNALPQLPNDSYEVLINNSYKIELLFDDVYFSSYRDYVQTCIEDGFYSTGYYSDEYSFSGIKQIVGYDYYIAVSFDEMTMTVTISQ